MIPELSLSNGDQFSPKPVSTRKYRGLRLPGSIMFKAEKKDAEIILQHFENPLWEIGCRIFRFLRKIKIRIKERKLGLRLEAVLTGELHTTDHSGKKTKLLPGQYHLTDIPEFTALFKKNSACSYFITHYSHEFIERLGFTDRFIPTTARQMPDSMSDLIQEALHNSYEEKLRNFYYENTIRELLLIHLTKKPGLLPGELNDKRSASIYQADSIIAEDLSRHFPIPELSKMAGTNAFYLKRGFQKIFNMGPFHRLLFRRMEQAKILLETTSKPINEVALEAGYGSVGAFITAFGKRFGMTPLEWREQKSGQGGKTNNQNE